MRAAWLALLGIGCAPLPTRHEAADFAATELVEVAIGFEPPLPMTGTARIDHESGWVWSGPAPPSGITVHMPPGPANLLLTVDDATAESIFVVPAAVDRWSLTLTR